MKSNLKVALVHDQLNQAGGAERVLLALSHLFPKAPIYTLIYDKNRLKGFEDKKVIESPVAKLPFAKKLFKWYLPFMPSAFESFDFSNYDLVISSCSALSKGVITGPNTQHICYCHTPTRYLWTDANEYTNSLRVPNFIKSILRVYLSHLRTWDQIASQRVDAYIANSACVQERIKNYYHKDSYIIYPPVDVHNYENITPQKGEYYLMTGRLRPYKKFDLAIKAFNKLKLPLKIIGTGEQEEELKKMAKDNIEFLGHVTEEQKRDIMSKAIAFINPQVEDFGMTVVEAMSAGKPVIAYKEGGALETVIPGVTGEFMNRQTWESLVDVVLNFDDSRYDSKTIQQHAQKFSSKIFLEEIKKFIEAHHENRN